VRGKTPISAVVITGLLIAGCGQGAASGSGTRPVLRIAAAADLQFALEELLELHRSDHPDVEAAATYGSSGNFFAQLQSEAPFDLYLSADLGYPRALEEKGLVAPDGVFPYAVGRIVVWVRDDSPIDVERLGIEALLDPSVRKIAIANPEHAPYGRAAVAALEDYDVYEEVSDRLVLGENISQTAQFVQSGSADIGIIALSLALAPDAGGRYWEIPAERHPPIEQGGAIMRWAADPDAARVFVDLMLGPEGSEVLSRFGFEQPR
jgi:molybdate transport system substrate-binding protein